MRVGKTRKQRDELLLIFYGVHRSESLALRHAKQLEKKNDAVLVRIERRNSLGQFSKNGRSFTFYLRREKDEELNLEWMVTIDYKQHKRGFNADLFIISSADATPTQLADQARKQLPSGKQFLANWIEGGFATISRGSFTEDRKQTRIRQFARRKK